MESFIINSSIPIIFISHDEQLIEHSANTIIHVEQLIRKTKSKITISRLCYKEYLDSRNAQWFFEEDLSKKSPVVKTGAEIPFTRYFYKYQQPKPSEELEQRFLELEKSVSERIARLFGGDGNA